MSLVTLHGGARCDGCAGRIGGDEWAVMHQGPRGGHRAYHRGCSAMDGARDCPFCGGRPRLVGARTLSATIECHSRGCRVVVRAQSETVERAVALWNGRV